MRIGKDERPRQIKRPGRWPRESIKEQEVVRNRRVAEDNKKDLPREADKGGERRTIEVI